MDAAGNRIRREVRFEIDRTPPRVSFSKRAARGRSASEVTVEGTAEGAVALSVNGVAATLQGERFSAGPFALGEGSQRFTVVAVDAAARAGSAAFLAPLARIRPSRRVGPWMRSFSCVFRGNPTTCSEGIRPLIPW